MKCIVVNNSYFVFKDPPDPPIKLKIGLVTKNTVHLSWKPPKNDGGSPVTHYIVECLAWDPTGKMNEIVQETEDVHTLGNREK